MQRKTFPTTTTTQRIGFAIAKRLLDEGANVMISSRKDANVEKALRSLNEYGQSVHGVQCHVGKREDRERLISAAVKRYNRLDILVSNAAVNPFMGNLMDTTEEVWTKIFEVNVAASFMLLKEATPLLRKSGGGSVVFVSSIAGFNPSPVSKLFRKWNIYKRVKCEFFLMYAQLLGAYSISKTALLGLCKAASFELALDNIRVNCVAPGIIQTKFSRAVGLYILLYLTIIS